MNTQIKKWGDSLALRIPQGIPQALAAQLHLEPGTPVHLAPENIHPEIDWGPPGATGGEGNPAAV